MSNELQIEQQQHNPYWTFQLVGWGIFFVASAVSGLVLYGFGAQIISYFIYVAGIGLLITHLYRNFIKWRDWHKLSIRKLTLRMLFMPATLAIVWVALTLPVSNIIFEGGGISGRLLLTTLATYSLILFTWHLIYFFYKLITSYKQSEIEKWRLRAAVKDAQLLALKSQINPHFIFNSLNNIRSLVVENPEKSREMITHLSGLLRYSIQFNKSESVSVEDEVEIVRNYLNLESIQFEDRLHFGLEIDPASLTEKIPPMAIQMLVENAIKHGISRLPRGGEIRVKCEVEDDQLYVEVLNTGQLSEPDPKRSGIGLQNATDRLKLLFGNMAELSLVNLNEDMVKASFTVPIMRQRNESTSRRRFKVSS